MELIWNLWVLIWEPLLAYFALGLGYVAWYRLIGLREPSQMWDRHADWGGHSTRLGVLVGLLLIWPFAVLVDAVFLTIYWFTRLVNAMNDIEL